VYLVVDRELGTRIMPLAQSGHVWAVASLVNSPVIQAVWARADGTLDDDPMGPGVTSFRADDLHESAESICKRLVEEIDIHHGEGDAPWTEIEVLGVPLTQDLRTAFEAIGGEVLLPTREGFICRRGAVRMV
jgi:hypothetical protein